MLHGPDGLEDFVAVGDGVLLGSEASILRLHYGPLAGVDTGADFDADIWALRGATTAAPTLTRVPRRHYPAGVRFHPHGLGLFNGTRLFVVNHAFAHGGERVDVFDIAHGATAAGPGIELHYVDSTPLGDGLNGAANDVAPVVRVVAFFLPALSLLTKFGGRGAQGPAEFYVTQWRPWAQPAVGERPHSWRSVAELVYFFVPPVPWRWTRIHHCRGFGAAARCRPVGPPGVAWNGIAVVDADTLAVADVFDSRGQGLVLFTRDTATGELTVSPRQSMLRPAAGDLTKLDNVVAVGHAADDGSPPGLWAAGVTRLLATAALLDRAAAAPPPGLLAPPARAADVRAGSQAVHVALGAAPAVTWFYHDGSLLAGWSVAHPVGPAHLVLGSFFDHGALVCRIAPERTRQA